MFGLVVALAMYLVLSPVQPALSVDDYRPQRPRAHLPLAAVVPRKAPGPVKKDPLRVGVETNARAAIVADWDSGAPLYEKNGDEPFPIASITKLMTALVVLDEKVPMDQEMEVWGSDQRPGGIPYVAPGEIVRVEDLFNLSLVASANGATVTLARSTGLDGSEFAAKMNAMAKRIGMQNATFVDPTGLDAENMASARDVAVLIRTALDSQKIRSVTTKKEYRFTAITGAEHAVRTTDDLLNSFLNKPPYVLLGGKTGYLSEAGYCFGAAAENERSNKVVSVVLGAATRDDRFKEVKSLMYWAFDAYEWPQTTAVSR